MNFRELQDAVIGTRFKEGQRSQVKRWLNIRHAWLMQQSDWPWLHRFTTLAFPAGTREVDCPENWVRTLKVVDAASGQTLKFLPYEQFFSFREAIEGPSGSPSYFTLRRESDFTIPTLLVDKTPASDLSLGVTALRFVGDMVADSDEPALPEPHHYMLVPGAVSTGLKLENDPTWRDLEDEFTAFFMALRDTYLPAHADENYQFGGDDLGYDGYF